jgi:uncharacterized protein with FMN-binding domain
MKRAILVSSGTLAGLVAVLTYSGADVPATIASGPAGQASLGGPPPLDGSTNGAPNGSTDPSAAASPAAGSPSPSAAAPSGTPTKAAAAPTKAAAAPTKAAPAGTAATPAAAPTKAAAPAPTKAAPAPKPTPTPAAVAKDYTGSLFTHKYGSVQVGIRVKGGKIIAVWPVVYPNGPSQPYSDFSIPVLKSETLSAQGAGIANVSGATLTWQSWKSSLLSAMHKAGL